MRLRRNSFLIAFLFAALAMAGVARAQERAKFLRGPGEARFAVGPGIDRETAAAMAQAPLVSHPLITWDGSFSHSATTFPLMMVGTDPTLGSHTTKVTALIVPIIFKFSNGTKLSPTKKVCVGSTKSA